MDSIDDLASACIKCGFCLESCPTFLLSGDERLSPRGRIGLTREAQGSGWTKDAAEAVDSCLSCVACETACPSGVQYGKIIEAAKAQTAPFFPGARKAFVKSLSNHRATTLQFGLAGLLPAGKIPAFLSKVLGAGFPEADLPRLPDPPPWPPFDESSAPGPSGEVAMLEGCVMRVLYPDVHEATRRLLRRVGFDTNSAELGCCGSLFAHNGQLDEAARALGGLNAALPPGLALVTDSAGCGSHLLRHGVAATVDVSTFLADHGMAALLELSGGLPGLKVAYHDACHLVHGQGVRTAPRTLIASVPGAELVDLAESDMCCGSAGTYNVFHPQTARHLLDRKWANIEATGCNIVVASNPGCQAWISQAAREHGSNIRVMHIVELVESCFSGLRPSHGP